MRISDDLSFIAYAKNVFKYEVDNSQIGYINEQNKLRKLFWKDIYIKRKKEDENFKDFLFSDDTILFVSGHMGTGKSTFLRHKYETKPENFNGLIINLRGKLKAFSKNDDFETTQNKIYSIINDAYQEATYNNLKAFLGQYFETQFKDEELSLEQTEKLIEQGEYSSYFNDEILFQQKHYDDANYNLDYEFSPYLKLLWERPPFNDFIDLIYATEILYHIRQDEIQDIKIELKVQSEDEKTYRKNIINALRGNHETINKIIRSIDLENQIVLHRKLFYKNTSKVHLLVLDNFDAVPVKIIKRFIADILINLIGKIRNSNEYPFSHSLGFKPFKIGISVRDENISRYFIGDALSAQTTQVSLGEEEEYIIPELSNYVNLSLNEEKCFEIIEQRIKFIKNNFSPKNNTDKINLNLFVKLTEDIYLDKDDRSINTKIGFINIKDFCNSSIRLILDHVSSSVELMIDKIDNNPRIIDLIDKTTFPYHLFKGLFIKSLWSHKYTNRLMNSFQESLKNELINDECCLLRLVLVYINKRGGKVRTKILVDRFTKIFDKSSLEVLELIFHLTNTQLREGELITVYQSAVISRAADIDLETSELRLNPKGFVFLDRILKHIDFYSVAFSKHGKKQKVLIEQNLIEFEENYGKILRHLNQLYDRHKFIYETTLLKLADEYTTFPFSAYSKDFIFKTAFHLRRVCDTHRAYILNYLQDISSDKLNYYLISDKEIQEIIEIIPIRFKGMEFIKMSDEEIEVQISAKNCPKEVKNLFNYCRSLSVISGKLDALSKTVN